MVTIPRREELAVAYSSSRESIPPVGTATGGMLSCARSEIVSTLTDVTEELRPVRTVKPQHAASWVFGITRKDSVRSTRDLYAAPLSIAAAALSPQQAALIHFPAPVLLG
jgi:hypothetical protein